MKYTEEQIKEFANNQYNKKSIEHRNLKQAYTEGFKKAIELVSSSNVIPDVIDCECDTDNYTKHKTKSGIVIYKCHTCGGCL